MQPFVGQICEFGFSFNPVHWAECSGGLISVSENQALFSLLGTSFGGDGRTTFGLPDLRGTAPMSQGRHSNSSYDWHMGQRGGAEAHGLSLHELPGHTHTANFVPGAQDTNAQVSVSTDIATEDTPTAGAFLARNDGGRNPGVPIYRADAGSGTVPLGGITGGSGASGSVEVQSAGGSQLFSLMQPVLTVNFCIAMEGAYPSRN